MGDIFRIVGTTDRFRVDTILEQGSIVRVNATYLGTGTPTIPTAGMEFEEEVQFGVSQIITVTGVYIYDPATSIVHSAGGY